MSKWRYSLACTAIILLSADLFAWRSVDVADTPPDASSLNYPLNDNQQGYTRESYLIWKPFEDDLDYADKSVREDNGPFDFTFKDKFKHPRFEWSSGVRLAVGKYLPNHDNWDINLIGTYYYTDADSDTTAVAANGESIFSMWNQAFLGNATKSSANWQMNYFTVDFLVGRYFSLTDTMQLHPFIGARGAFIYQDYRVRFETPIINHQNLRFDADHDFLGGGPRIGTDFSYSFGHGWSFLASLSAAFLYGHYDVNEEIDGVAFVPAIDSIEFKIRDDDTMLRTNVEGSIGLEWEKWVRKGTVRIAPSFQVEVTDWFAIKRWVETHVPSSRIPTATDINLQSRRRYSDLGLFGFNVNLHVDF